MCRWFDSAPGHQHSCALAPFSGSEAFLLLPLFFYNLLLLQIELRVDSKSMTVSKVDPTPSAPKKQRDWFGYLLTAVIGVVVSVLAT